MTLYNVAVPVIDLVDADSEQGAIRLLIARLRRAGFEVYDGKLPKGANAFESEVQAT